MKPWKIIPKGDIRARKLADGHYTRRSPGHPQWTRPGYTLVLLAEWPAGAALWCWWRPKWEDGRPGTQRKDGLRVIECTMFRRVGDTPLASDLTRAAVAALASDGAARALHYDTMGSVEYLITGVSTTATARRRSRHHAAGHCYRVAGWEPFSKRAGRADVWLRLPCPDCAEAAGVREVGGDA